MTYITTEQFKRLLNGESIQVSCDGMRELEIGLDGSLGELITLLGEAIQRREFEEYGE